MTLCWLLCHGSWLRMGRNLFFYHPCFIGFFRPYLHVQLERLSMSKTKWPKSSIADLLEEDQTWWTSHLGRLISDRAKRGTWNIWICSFQDKIIINSNECSSNKLIEKMRLMSVRPNWGHFILVQVYWCMLSLRLHYFGSALLGLALGRVTASVF